ncbi:MAG: sigma-70 family RNA polymerase sigma factor [Planctomycetes bacterium]|nr:sigma-70 family RNA polymerase sigma factor [Planctomycetota bacterium]
MAARDGLERQEEARLVGAAQSGDSAAFEELVRRSAPRLSALAYQLTGDAEAARDLSQEVFLKAFRGIRSLRSGASLQAWLFRIAANEAASFLRRKARERRRLAPAAEAVAAGAGPLERLVAEEERAAVLAALDALPARQRSVLVLRHLHGLSTAEVAETLKCSANSVKANLCYALRFLREKLAGGPDRE